MGVVIGQPMDVKPGGRRIVMISVYDQCLICYPWASAHLTSIDM
jgi:hypothetical protein